jgi:hypothetical protein
MLYCLGIIDRARPIGIGRMAIVALIVPVTFPGYCAAIGFAWDCEVHVESDEAEATPPRLSADIDRTLKIVEGRIFDEKQCAQSVLGIAERARARDLLNQHENPFHNRSLVTAISPQAGQPLETE